MQSPHRPLSKAEQLADRAVHAIGIALGSAGAALLAGRLAGTAGAAELTAVSIYLLTLMASLLASAAYNMWPDGRVRTILRRVDHSAIFLLIAGTYTPFMVEGGSWRMLAGVWAIALFGIVLKLARPGRFDGIAILLYLALGWSGLIIGGNLTASLPPGTLWLILAGGIVYSLGVPIHLLERVRFQKAIWHGLVLVAASIHFAAIALMSTA